MKGDKIKTRTEKLFEYTLIRNAEIQVNVNFKLSQKANLFK